MGRSLEAGEVCFNLDPVSMSRTVGKLFNILNWLYENLLRSDALVAILGRYNIEMVALQSTDLLSFSNLLRYFK